MKELNSIQAHKAEAQWSAILAAFPSDLDLGDTARTHKALRRKRGVPDAQALLRLALMYGPGGLSLRGCAAWASAIGVAEVADVSLMERLMKAGPWLEYLVSRLLSKRLDHSGGGKSRRTIRIADGTVLKQPGSKYGGSKRGEWRLHALYTPGTGFTHLEITDIHGRESLRRGEASAGEIRLADRGYAKSKDLCIARESGADYVTRIGWRTTKVRLPNGDSVQVFDLLKAIPGEVLLMEQDLLVDGGKGYVAHPARLVMARKPPDIAAQELKRIRIRSRRNKAPIDPKTLVAAKFTLVLTTLPAVEFPVGEIMDLYRTRWQIEIAFKRLKGLLHADKLRAKNAALARSWIAAHLIAALVLDTITQEFLDSPP